VNAIDERHAAGERLGWIQRIRLSREYRKALKRCRNGGPKCPRCRRYGPAEADLRRLRQSHIERMQRAIAAGDKETAERCDAKVNEIDALPAR
jgi:hypothetical protein